MSDLGFNTYKRYKSGTTKIATWLVETAKSRSQKLFNRLAAKTGSLNAKGNNKIISVREFLTFANELASDERLVVPYEIFKVLEDVISLRRQFSHLLVDANTKKEEDGHLFFIRTLQEVRELLKPRREKTIKSGRQDPPKELSERLGKLSYFPNLFEHLSLEETANDGPTPILEQPTASSETPQSTQRFETAYDAQLSEIEEKLFACVCFMEDLKKTRSQLMIMWMAYRDGTTSLSTAALTTDTVFHEVKRQVEALKRTLGEDNGTNPDYSKPLHYVPGPSSFISWTYEHLTYGASMREGREFIVSPDSRETFVTSDFTAAWTESCLNKMALRL